MSMQDPGETSFFELADAYRVEGLLADAVRLCRDGLARHPASLRGRLILAKALLASGDVSQAALELAWARASDPEHPEVLDLAREMESRRARESSSASGDPTDSSGGEPADPLASATLANLYASQGDDLRAAAIHKELRTRRQQDHLHLLEAYRNAARHARA
jgi:predicted Zn-dependent protease